MPMFARRRLQAMLDEVAAGLTDKKLNDLLGRLGKKTDARNVIGAEMELALLWAIQRVAHLSVEPLEDEGGNNPDAYSDDLLGHPAFIEVTAVSDEALSGEDLMRRTAKKIVDEVNRMRRGFGNRLHFEFHEHRIWTSKGSERCRMVPSEFAVDAGIRETLRRWISSGHAQLRLEAPDLDATITLRDRKQHPLFNFHSSLPPLAYSLTDNPIFQALKAKKRQLADRPAGTLGCVFLADAGCRPLRLLNERDPLGQYKSGAEIIDHFLRREGGLDVVAVFSAQRRRTLSSTQETLSWGAAAFCRAGIDASETNRQVVEVAQQLPCPRFEGYQAKTICQQGAFAPQERGWYMGAEIASGRDRMTVKVSSRLLQEYLAGRITKERFDDLAFGSLPNMFERNLSLGRTITLVSIEDGGLDEDDDKMVIEFEKDPAASPLENRRKGGT